MERIEKVIKGLECCEWSDAGRYDGYEPMYENCEKCPYNNEQDSKSECNDKLRQDALKLIKEQAPRVLTWDEVERAEVCWTEQRGYEPYAELDAADWNPEYYGKEIRCWSAKPTDKQRWEAKWNG